MRSVKVIEYGGVLPFVDEEDKDNPARPLLEGERRACMPMGIGEDRKRPSGIRRIGWMRETSSRASQAQWTGTPLFFLDGRM